MPRRIKAPYRSQKYDWPSTLITRLTASFSSQAKTSEQEVSVLVHEERHPFGRDTLRILGVYESIFLANQKAMDFFRERYSVFFEHSDDTRDWSNFVEQTPFNFGDVEQGNKVRWEVSDRGEVSLMAVSGLDGDKYKVYVKYQVIHRRYDRSDSEHEDADGES
ncbi:hypothetical protein N7493_001773 [Penicillium malachiteum]|uniref:Uncharacterized protein n=1 Tax=Penicillium malachiteum TaxID=1324776 RepID=A0AAD6N096_9EURO|nr:hypothetical protein N7493_001773 [Penicillium malachiteum]